MNFKIAIAQYAPIHLDLWGCLDKLEQIIRKASLKGADMVVFGETWLAGYPAWLDYSPDIGLWDYEPMKKVYHTFHENSVNVNGKERQFLERVCKQNKIALCVGINEKVSKGKGQGTVYNSILTINNKGKLINHHRKLMPTFTEKLLYGLGDASGLKTTNINNANIGSLICWEHWMPLTRQVLHDQGEQIHIALWPMLKEMNQVASQHYAFEGRCYVVAVGQIMKVEDIPAGIKKPEGRKPTELILGGGSCVIAPNGDYILKPIMNKEKLAIIDLDLSLNIMEKMTLDISGHYQRPDIFQLRINKKRK